jgi:hypothetical protein
LIKEQASLPRSKIVVIAGAVGMPLAQGLKICDFEKHFPNR